MMILENDVLRAVFSETDGQLIELYGKASGQNYLHEGDPAAAFRTMTAKGIQEPEAVFQPVSRAADFLSFEWQLEKAVLKAEVTLLPDGLSFRARLQNDEDSDIRAFEYPIIGRLSDFGSAGFLAHSYATGVLIEDPQRNMPQMDGPQRYFPYPEGFSGATMQFFTYYAQSKGGLYFAATDSEAHQKWLNSYIDNGGLVASHMYGFENIGRGSLLDMPYDFQVRLTKGLGWEEAADLYKPWALDQAWARRGKAALRPDDEKASWLLEDVGAATFGINAGHDRTKWLDRYREDIGTKIFHILGPDWTKEPQNFYNSLPGDLPDWEPANFNQANINNMKQHGDPFAAFEFDFFVGLNKSNPKKLMSHLQRFPAPTFSHDAYNFSMLCPADPFTKDFHREKNLMMIREADMDAMYYDISANNLIKICLSDKHGHAPGGGYQITQGYQDVYSDTKHALDKEAGRYIPLGTEMINETLLGELDYYQARAWAQPSSTLETWPFREQMRKGTAKMIPLFSYVYNELGTVRLDGWGKLVEETGNYFHYIVSQVYLWGGLYELNHEYSPMEMLDGDENKGEDHYFRFDPQNNAYSPVRARYLKQFAAARVGEANSYWAYGTMAAQPSMNIPSVFYDWYHYNHGQGDSSYKAKGSYRAAAVVTSAFLNQKGSYALFLSNARDSGQRITIPLSVKALRLPDEDRTLSLTHGFGGEVLTHDDLGMLRRDEQREITLTLQPHTLYMLEIK